MAKTTKVKTEELAGAALLWVMDSIEGTPPPLPGQMQLPFARQINPATVDRLIAKYHVWVEPGWSCSGWPMRERIATRASECLVKRGRTLCFEPSLPCNSAMS